MAIAPAIIEASAAAYITPQEYLRRERLAEIKSEYYEGEILPMAGGTRWHNMICADAFLGIGMALLANGGECTIHNSDQKVRVAEGGPYFYPDGSVVCGDPVFDDDECLLNPIAIIEVLSASTKAFDRDEKFRAYRRIPSLRHYILIASNTVRVEHFEKLASGFWALVGEYEQRSDTLTLTEPSVQISLKVIYARYPDPSPHPAVE